jgi:hypothetical protein
MGAYEDAVTKADQGLAVTKDEAKAIVCGVQRTCRGPMVAPEKHTAFRRAIDLLRRGETNEQKERAKAMLAELGGQHVEHQKAVAAKLAEDADVAHALGNALRPGCGYDFNETILANPLDGLEHAYVCPRCLVAGSYRAPMIEVQA